MFINVYLKLDEWIGHPNMSGWDTLDDWIGHSNIKNILLDTIHIVFS